jgi:four helix bundle protein
VNIEHSTSNVERPTEGDEGGGTAGRVYDLEERLLEYAVRVIRLVEALPNSRAGNHVAGQLLRSGTAPLPNHGEAQAAESRADFIHKMKVCLKELRESARWLRLVQQVPLVKPSAKVEPLRCETEELIRIFTRSVQTSERRRLARSKLDVRS